MTVRSICCDARSIPLEDESVDLVVTSPPYFAQVDYGHDNQIGAETSPWDYLAALSDFMREMRRVVKPEGNVFVVLDDKYQADGPFKRTRSEAGYDWDRRQPKMPGLPMKSMMMLPYRFAIDCVDHLGFALRNDVIWDKGGGGPDRATDRAWRTHEYVFHFVKPRGNRYRSFSEDRRDLSVWAIPPGRHSWHPAPFPAELVERIVTRWCPPGGLVLDPYGGSGVVSRVSEGLGFDSVYCDVNPEYVAKSGL